MVTYRLNVPGKWFILTMLGLQACVFVAVAVWAVLSPGGNGPPIFVVQVFIAFPALMWFHVLTIPHVIILDSSGLATFKSVLRAPQFHLSEIRSIQPRGNQFGFFNLDYGTGKQLFLAQFDGFHDFLIRLKSVNPTVLLRGC